MNFIKKLKSLLLFSSLLLNPLVMAQSNTLKTENLLMNQVHAQFKENYRQSILRPNQERSKKSPAIYLLETLSRPFQSKKPSQNPEKNI